MSVWRKVGIAAAVAVAALALGCGGDSTSPAEHRQAACGGFYDIIERAAAGQREQSRDSLEDTLGNARDADDDAFEEAFDRWEDAIRSGGTSRTDAASLDIDAMCERRAP